MKPNASTFAPSFADVVHALAVLKAVESRYHHCPEWFGDNDWTPNYALVVDDLMSYQSGLCASQEEARLRDMPKPYAGAGRLSATSEGAPEYEFSRVQAESVAANA